ncbi:hypothetical protein SAMN02745221_01560 [Thermosyntropha lipolytica DSM 11003]|uniref:DUF1850 domain-containing protein n=1 Tax=Thermosyntropha lipolytica DSM 11003 TaxID=1123382 RepID=A0A1M5PU42_9FIRM|nr:DUF1850 domain-containing protein [Thermosyntropha lipolytica]SHH04999.1 hypothetical protein SAMN02745221_01560 [Thermosyntropha lipolytica DSM 11003]
MKNIRWQNIGIKAGLFISFIVIAIILFYPVPTLVLTAERGDEVLLFPLLKEKSFTYEYLHSVQKTPVQEHFVPAPGNVILLTSTTYQSLGVGLPFMEEEGEFIEENGVFRIENLNRKYEKITWGFMPIARQALIYKDKKYRFENYCHPGELLTLKIEKKSLAAILYRNWQAGKEAGE